MGIVSWIIMTDLRRANGMLAAAQSIGATTTALVIGEHDLAQRAASLGFDCVKHIAIPEGAPTEAAAAKVAVMASAEQPRLVLGNDSPSTRVVLGAVSGAVDASVIGSVQEISCEGDGIIVRRHISSGMAIETVLVSNAAVLVFNGLDAESAKGVETAVETVEVEAVSDKLVGVVESERTGLATAERIVGIGMGLKSKNDFVMIDDLARVLNAETACTLPICDSMHWCSSDRVIGSSHNSAAPQLYFAIGISGSPNHVSGVRDAKTIVAINNDPEAEIFRSSKYGIVGDLYEIVPVLTSQLK